VKDDTAVNEVKKTIPQTNKKVRQHTSK